MPVMLSGVFITVSNIHLYLFDRLFVWGSNLIVCYWWDAVLFLEWLGILDYWGPTVFLMFWSYQCRVWYLRFFIKEFVSELFISAAHCPGFDLMLHCWNGFDWPAIVLRKLACYFLYMSVCPFSWDLFWILFGIIWGLIVCY